MADYVVNPLGGDVTENVRYVTYECSDAKRIKVDSQGEMTTKDTEVSMSVIYAEDGTVYLRDLLDGLYMGYGVYAVKGCWLVGRLSEDGRRIDIEPGQKLTESYYPRQYDDRFYPMLLSGTDAGMRLEIDEDAASVSIRIEADGTLVAEDVDGFHPWGVLDEDNKISSAYVFHAFVPTEEQPVLPPAGLPKMDYDFKYYPMLSRNVKFGDIGKRLKVVQHGEDIYVQGCSYDHCEAWMVGHREGGSYIFKDRQRMADKYFVSVDSYTEYEEHTAYTKFIEVITPLGEDVSFASSGSGDVLTTDMMFKISLVPDSESRYDYDYMDLHGDAEIYYRSVFSRIPDGPQFPQAPEIKVDNYGGDTSTVTICGSYFDTNGYVMDVERMYYKLCIDGEPYVFTNESFFKSSYLTEPTEYLSYARMNISLDTVNIPYEYRFSIELPSDQVDSVEAELIYIQDGREYSSSVGTVTAGGNPWEDNTVYDLTGRGVSPESLSPGIYIRGGKKFVVR